MFDVCAFVEIIRWLCSSSFDTFFTLLHHENKTKIHIFNNKNYNIPQVCQHNQWLSPDMKKCKIKNCQFAVEGWNNFSHILKPEFWGCMKTFMTTFPQVCAIVLIKYLVNQVSVSVPSTIHYCQMFYFNHFLASGSGAQTFGTVLRKFCQSWWAKLIWLGTKMNSDLKIILHLAFLHS